MVLQEAEQPVNSSSNDGPDISISDRQILRQLAGEVAELAALPTQTIKQDLWYRHNALEATRPLVLCFPENSWDEIITLRDLHCEGSLARQWEYTLRKEIFWGASLDDDRVITADFSIPHIHSETDWGLTVTQTGGNDGGAYTWDPPLKSYAELERLRFPEIQVDYDTTRLHLALAEETFGDILHVRLKTKWQWSDGLTQILAQLRGLQQLMLDMYDHPDELHRLMAFLCDGRMARLDFLEAHRLLNLDNDGAYVGSGGYGWSHELPADDFEGHVRASDIWGFAESQETVGVSPDMFREFILPYQMPLLQRYGLNCYGCCEPLHPHWQAIKNIPNLRRVSVSPWADIRKMAEQLGDRTIYSWKPNPVDLAMDSFDEDNIRAKLREGLRITRDCRVEVIMKDTHTIRKDPRRVIRWVQIALEEARAL
jgi:hypothetical protein